MPGLLLTILCASLGGLIIGVALGRLKFNEKVDEAFAKGKKEVEDNVESEKSVLTDELAEELAQIRDGIISTAEAYGEVVKVIESKLGHSPKLYLNKGGEQKLLSVDIAGTRAIEAPEVPQATESSATSEETTSSPADKDAQVAESAADASEALSGDKAEADRSPSTNVDAAAEALVSGATGANDTGSDVSAAKTAPSA